MITPGSIRRMLYKTTFDELDLEFDSLAYKTPFFG